jgi:hypothetical protein
MGDSKQASKVNVQAPIHQQPTQGTPIIMPANQYQEIRTYQGPPGPGGPVMVMIPTYKPIPGVPIGLEPLYGIDAIVIEQEIELLEVFTGFETANRYNIQNMYGQRIYFAAEVTECCARCLLGHNRPFIINIIDGMGKEVMVVERVCNFSLCWWGGETAGSHVTVKLAATGELIGTVRQRCNCWTPTYEVYDHQAQLQMVIRGPSCGACCPIVMCCDAEFNVFAPTERGLEQVGAILKKFSLKEVISDAQNFGIRLPPGLHPNIKATLLAATFSIDFSFFERNGRGRGEKKSNQRLSGCSCCISLSVVVVIIVVLLILQAFN